MNQLEKDILDSISKGQDFSLERALLIGCGLETEEQIEEYTKKLDIIHTQFRKHMGYTLEKLSLQEPLLEDPENDTQSFQYAEELFKFFWKTKKKSCNRSL